MTDRMEVVVFNRLLGTASGWDGEPGDSVWYYDFEPVPNSPLYPCETLTINEAEDILIFETESFTSTLPAIFTLSQIPTRSSNGQ